MKIIKLFLSLMFAALLVISCGGANTDQLGGPGESPEDLLDAAAQVINNANLESILSSTTGTDEAAEQNAAVEQASDIVDNAVIPVPEEPVVSEDTSTSSAATDTTVSETASTDDESVAEPEETIEEVAATTEETDTADTPVQTDLAYTIDSTQGRWMTVPEKELFSQDTEKAVQAKIKELDKEIKEISADVKKALKDNEEKGKSEDKGKADKTAFDIEAAQDKIRDLREEIASLRDQIGEGGRVQSGIYTAWANQSLRLNITGGEEGWYKLVIVAKNQGKIPASYDKFSFTVLDMSDEKMLGTLSVKASDTAYNRGRLVFKLDKAQGKTLDILWTNDFYKQEGNVTYDANVQIKQVLLTKVKEPKMLKKTIRKGDQYAYVDGRWFFEKGTAWTAWADQTIGYNFNNLKGGKYELIVTAKNKSSLGLAPEYKEFKLEVNSDNASETVMIPAHDVKWMKGSTTIVLPEGNATIYLTWINDSYLENEYDANINIKSIKLKRVADSTLTAYLLRTTTGNRMMLSGILVLLVGAIMAVSLYNKKRLQATA
ncbi:MAG: hypothetical protein CVV44_21530 [Spirochaetae bacterium HGW-Spirochaetae-1]|jgi:hypothetical protein|nr:MAG: hypothetical protein CVV44_21530 [Spirochaetae bacterium HGW-Spirochaetae-1]